MQAAITFMVVITPLCNSPSGMYILIGFSLKTSVGPQIFHQVAPFCQVAVLRFSDIHKWYMLGRVIFDWMTGKNVLGLLQRGVLFHTPWAITCLPKVSRGNDQSSIKFKSKLIVSFANGSGNCKLIECKGDSSVACTFNRFICFFFSFLFWLLANVLF